MSKFNEKLMHAALCILLLSGFGTPLFARAFHEIFPGVSFSEANEYTQMLEAFDYQQGQIDLPGQIITLTIPEGYYYLNPQDTRKVIVDLWENPYTDGLGMIFPAKYVPVEDAAWGVAITWDQIGYVRDEDADSIDYFNLLKILQSDTQEENTWRREQGYAPVTLVGWAQAPTYDKAEHKLHWAKEIALEGVDDNTVNYNLRALGRKGVLQLNFIARMDQLDEVRAALPQVAAIPSFIVGERYEDFSPSHDVFASVDLVGLITGKALDETGFWATIRTFLRTFWFFLLLPPIWLIIGYRRKAGS